ncbi:hypothetical protein MHYP_G00005810 [Metynnis hypsauchen]
MRGLPPNNYSQDLPLGTQEFTAPIQSNPRAIEAWENKRQQVVMTAENRNNIPWWAASPVPAEILGKPTRCMCSVLCPGRFEGCGGSGLSDGDPTERGGGLFMGPACSSSPRPAWWPLATPQEGFLVLCPHLQA